MNLQKVQNKIQDALKKFIGDRKAIIGISGGIDSAVVAQLCANALGPKNVIGIELPYASQSTRDSTFIIDYIRIENDGIPITNIVDEFLDFNKGHVSKSDLVMGNIKARVRMTYLYAMANLHNGFVIGTTNKTELMLGYYTKYGDGACDIEPIADLYKTEIFAFANNLGIPRRIIEKVPSAELWDDQTDEGEIGLRYERIDRILKQENPGVDSEAEQIVSGLMLMSEHKRNMPPIIHVRENE